MEKEVKRQVVPRFYTDLFLSVSQLRLNQRAKSSGL